MRPFTEITQEVVGLFDGLVHKTIAEIGRRERSKTLVAAVLVHKMLLQMMCFTFPSIAEKIFESHKFAGNDNYTTGYDVNGLDSDICRRPWLMAVYSTGETINFECETIGGCEYNVRILTNCLFKTDNLGDLFRCVNVKAVEALCAIFLPFVCRDTLGDMTISSVAS